MSNPRPIKIQLSVEDADKLLDHLKSKDRDFVQITLEMDRERTIEEIESRFPELVEE